MILNHARKTPRVALAIALTIGLAAAAALLPARADDPQPAGTKAGSVAKVTASQLPPDIGRVYDLKDLDRHPSPRGIHAAPAYPADMKSQGISGEVVVLYIVDRNGDVREVSIVGSSRREFETSVIQAVQKWKYRPGRKDGDAVATWVRIPIKFALGDKDQSV